MRFHKLNIIKQNSQKNRTVGSFKKICLKYGTTSFFTKKKVRFELIYFVFLKKFFKNLNNSKIKKTLNRRGIWFFFKSNYPLSKKSKNSRMGKGKGVFLRWVVILHAFSNLVEFNNYNFIVLKKILQKLNKISGSKFYLFKM